MSHCRIQVGTDDCWTGELETHGDLSKRTTPVRKLLQHRARFGCRRHGMACIRGGMYMYVPGRWVENSGVGAPCGWCSCWPMCDVKRLLFHTHCSVLEHTRPRHSRTSSTRPCAARISWRSNLQIEHDGAAPYTTITRRMQVCT